MKGSIKAWMLLLAAWIWWTTSLAGSIRIPPSPMLKNELPVDFTTAGATKESYSQFMVSLRGRLASDYESHTIPVMRDPSTIPESDRYLLVELSNNAQENITLALDLQNAYVVGYRTGDQYFYFDDAPESARSDLFPEVSRANLRLRYNYDALQVAARRERGEIEVGIPALDQAISSLYHTNPFDSAQSRRTVARSLMVIVQMVSEAARFKYIEQQVRLRYTNGQFQTFIPDNTMLSLENNWGSLSTEIQESNNGVFSRPVTLQRRDSYDTFNVESVTTIIMLNLALLLFNCKQDQGSNYQFSPILRSIVSYDDDDDNTCTDIPEPTVRIGGRYGKCVDLSGGIYDDGTPIILWPCKYDTSVNQLWTLKRDNTIQQKGKCLTATGSNPGNTIMIHNCDTATSAATLWHTDDNGIITNLGYELVLSATSGDDGSKLTVEKNIYVPYQAWLPTNDTQPSLTTIFGYKDLCLTGGGTVSILDCTGDDNQKWEFYPDSTIRSKLNMDTCLACDGDNQGSKVVVPYCEPGSSRHRWGFKSDGSFYNLVTGLVMDVKGSDPDLHEIIMWTFTGNPNQKWLPGL